MAPEVFLRAIGNGARASKIRSREARNRFGPRKGQGWGLPFGLPFELRQIKTFKNINEGSGTPANAGYHRRILRCGARPFGARTLDGVPPRLSPKGIIPSQRLSFRPGFLGRGLHGRYPPSPVPVQGCTSHPGRNAGRHDAQAARERTANPPAGTALAPMPRCASAPCPSLERDCEVTDIGTNVKEKVTPELRLLRRAFSGRSYSSWPGLSRPSTPCFLTAKKTWMPATSAGMTD